VKQRQETRWSSTYKMLQRERILAPAYAHYMQFYSYKNNTEKLEIELLKESEKALLEVILQSFRILHALSTNIQSGSVPNTGRGLCLLIRTIQGLEPPTDISSRDSPLASNSSILHLTPVPHVGGVMWDPRLSPT